MINERKFVPRRVRNVIVMMASLYVLAIVYKLMYQTGIDQLISCLFVVSVYFIIVIFTMAFNRTNGSLCENSSQTYSLLTVLFLCSVVIMFLTTFLPDFCSLALVIALLLSAASNTQVGLVLAFSLDLVYCMNIHHNFYELACFFTLSILGAVFMQAFQNKSHRLFVNIIIFSINICLPCIFYFLANKKIHSEIFLWSTGAGIVSVLLILLLIDKISIHCESGNQRRVEEIIEKDFPLVQEIQNFSPRNYEHAQKVSTLSYKCAKIAGVNAAVAAAGGFYYRVGRMEGEPFIQNGVELAQMNLFPDEVIKILSEYNGIEALPSTPESAIVHLIDALVLRFEQFEHASGNNWNRELLIYQTMNEKSSSGIYDKSGLSINQYTKIKEFLVRGEDLL